MKRILVWGAGGHGKVVGDLVRACGHELVGYVDGDEDRMGDVAEPGGATVLVTERELLESVDSSKLPFDASAVAVALGNNGVRLNAARRLGAFLAPAMVHPRATVSPTAHLAPGTVVLAGAVVNAAARVGTAVIVNTSCVIEHDCVLADGVHVSPGAVLAGGVEVGECSWIGAGAVVIQSLRIGSSAIVGAGAAVIRDVPEGAAVAGVPARRIEVGKHSNTGI